MNLNEDNKRKLKIVLWALIPVLVGIVLVFILSFGVEKINLKNIFNSEDNVTNVIDSFKTAELGLPKASTQPSSEPSKYFYISKALNDKLKISAEAFLVGDLNTGEIIMSRNPNQKLPIAS